MDDQELRELIAAIKAGRFSRRDFIRGMVGLGLTAPLASQLLVHAGLAQSSTPIVYKPTRAGGGGALRTLFWQAPTSLNPHFAVGAKDVEGAGIFYEPLTSWDPDGNLVPMPPPDRGTEGFPCRFYNIDRSGLRFAAVTDMPSAATPPFSMFGISAASSVSVAVASGVSEVRIGLAAGGGSLERTRL